MAKSFKTELLRQTKYSGDKCAAFLKLFGDNPARAMDGCDDIFLCASRLAIINEIANSLANAESKGEAESDRINFLIDHLSAEMQAMARWPRRSTSVTSNLYNKCRLASVAEMIVIMQDWQNVYAR